MSKSSKQFSPEMGGNYAIPLGVVNVDYLVGKMLTLVDATFTDKEQREAYKSLTKTAIYEWFQNSYSYYPVIDWSYSIDTNEFKVREVHKHEAQSLGSNTRGAVQP